MNEHTKDRDLEADAYVAKLHTECGVVAVLPTAKAMHSVYIHCEVNERNMRRYVVYTVNRADGTRMALHTADRLDFALGRAFSMAGNIS